MLEYEVKYEEIENAKWLTVSGIDKGRKVSEVCGRVNENGALVYGCSNIQTFVPYEGYGRKTIIEFFRQAKKTGEQFGFTPKWAMIYALYSIEQGPDDVMHFDWLMEKLRFTSTESDEKLFELSKPFTKENGSIVGFGGKTWHAKLEDIIR